jgi:hypothetical protein
MSSKKTSRPAKAVSVVGFGKEHVRRAAFAQPRALVAAAAVMLGGSGWWAVAQNAASSSAPVSSEPALKAKASGKASLKNIPSLVEAYGNSRAQAAAAGLDVNASASTVSASAISAGSASTTRRFPLTEVDLTPNTPSDEREPAYSPGGDFIVFASNGTDSDANGVLDNRAPASGAKYHLWMISRTGSNLRQLTGLAGGTDANRSQRNPAWSPDGNQIVYSDESNSTTSQLFVLEPFTDVNTTTSGIQPRFEQRTFSLGQKLRPTWSPNGQQIAFATNRDPRNSSALPNFDIFSIEPSGNLASVLRLTGGPTDTAGDAASDLNPAFSLVGSNALYFSSTRGAPSGGRRIWIMNVNGDNKRQITDPQQRPAGSATNIDDYPAPSLTSKLSNFNPAGSAFTERVAFQSNSKIDSTDTTNDFNIWTVTLNSAASTGQQSPTVGAVMVGSYSTDEVKQFDSSSGAFVSNFVTDGDTAEASHVKGIAYGPDVNDDGTQDLFVARPDAGGGDGDVRVYDGNTGADLGVFASGGGLTNPTGLAFSATKDRLFVASGADATGAPSSNKIHSYTVSTFNPGTPAAGSPFTDGTGITNGIEGIAVGPDLDKDGVGELYASSAADNSIVVYNGRTGAFRNTLVASGSSGLLQPKGIAFISGGIRIAVASSGTNDVKVFSGTTGAPVNIYAGTNSIGVGSLNRPEGVTLGPDGLLYVSSFGNADGNTVHRFNPSSGAARPAPGKTGSTFISEASLRGASYIAFTSGIEAPGNLATLETNRYSSSGAYTNSKLPYSTADKTGEVDSDKADDREPSFSRTSTDASVTSQLTFASQRKAAFIPNAPIVNPGGVTHDLWTIATADFTPPALIPQAVGNQQYPVVSPGPQSPFQIGRPRTYETGLRPNAQLVVSLALREVESGLGTVSVVIRDADKPQFTPILTKANDNHVTQTVEEIEAEVVAGTSPVTMRIFDDGPPSAGGHENQTDAIKGDGIYFCIAYMKTPTYSGDFYIDVNVSDIAGNQLTYDNLWGFSTRQFAKGSAQSDLFVSDYTAGQKFPFLLTNGTFRNGFPVAPFGGTHYGTSAPDDELLPRFYNMRPIESYYLTQPAGAVQDGTTDPFVTWSNGTTFNGVDVWRVQCRGPVPQEIINTYRPRIARQLDPEDFASGMPTAMPEKTRPVAVADAAIIWASPYTSEVFAGPGTLDDAVTQTRLTNFLEDGGRMFISGKDVLYGLSDNGTASNDFMQNELRAGFGGEVSEDKLEGEAGQYTQYFRVSNYNPDWDNPQIPDRMPGTPSQEANENTYRDGARNGAGSRMDVITPIPGNGITLTETYSAKNQRVGQNITKTRASEIKSKIAFMSFGFEGVNRRYGKTTGSNPVLISPSVRNEMTYGIREFLKTGIISGTVFNAQTNLPIPNFVLQLTGSGDTYFVATDENGKYEVAGLPSNFIQDIQPALYDDQGTLRPVNTGYLPGPIVRSAAFANVITSNINLRVQPVSPGSISGRIALSGVTPEQVLPNVPVLLRSLERSPDFPNGGFYAQLTRTDAGGRFSFSNVPSGVEMEVVVNPNVEDIPEESGLRANYAGPNNAAGKRIIPDEARPDDIIAPVGNTFVLNDLDNQDGDDTNDAATDTAADSGVPIFVPRDYISGYVKVNRNGVVTPVKDAKVEILQGTTVVKTVLTDVDGFYSFSDVGYDKTKTYSIRASKSVFTKTVPLNIQSSNNIRVPDIIFFDQVVTGLASVNGVYMADIVIEVLENGRVIRTAKTNSKGEYILYSVPAGNLVIRGTKDGARASVNVTVVDGKYLVAPEIKIVRQELTGRVILNKTATNSGTGVSGATVSLLRNGQTVATRQSGAGGSYSFAGIDAGDYTVRANYKGDVSNTASVTVGAGEVKGADDLFVYLQTVRATVTLNGAPTSGATVTLLQGANAVATGTTNANGNYIFPDVVAGTYTIRATKGGDTATSASFTVPRDGSQVTAPTVALLLQSISGTVTLNGNNASGATVQLEQNGQIINTATTGTNGQYSFTGLTPGTYVLRAISGNLRSSDVSVTVLRGTNRTGVNLAMFAAGVTGRVLVNGVGSSGIPVTLLQGTTTVATTTSGTNGTYGFVNVPAGQYTIRAAKDSESATVSVTVANSQTPVTAPDLNLLFQKVTGKVTVGGVGTKDATVTLRTTSSGGPGPVLQTVTTDSSGNYTFNNVDDGTYLVTASKNGASGQRVITVARNGGTVTVPDIALSLQNVSGRVTLNGASAVGATVSITLNGASSAVASTTTGSDGTYTFDSINAGTYTVTATLNNMSKSETVTVTSGSSTTVPTIELGTVSPTPTPRPDDYVPGSTYTISTPYADSSVPTATTTVGKAFSLNPKADDGSTNYILKRFDAKTQSEVTITDPNTLIRRGEGFRIQPVNKSVRLQRPVDDASRIPTAVDTFTITLYRNPSLPASVTTNGLNLIGFPFDPLKFSSVDWNATSFRAPDGRTYANLNQAVAGGAVDREFYTFDDNGVKQVTTTMVPFKGYYVKTYIDGLQATLTGRP